MSKIVTPRTKSGCAKEIQRVLSGVVSPSRVAVLRGSVVRSLSQSLFALCKSVFKLNLAQIVFLSGGVGFPLPYSLCLHLLVFLPGRRGLLVDISPIGVIFIIRIKIKIYTQLKEVVFYGKFDGSRNDQGG
jgi:hypothetical protein